MATENLVFSKDLIINDGRMKRVRCDIQGTESALHWSIRQDLRLLAILARSVQQGSERGCWQGCYFTKYDIYSGQMSFLGN